MIKTIILTIFYALAFMCCVALVITPNLIEMGYHTDKMLHIFMFAIITMLIVFRTTSIKFLMIFIAMLLCGGFIVEAVQIITPNRSAQLGDLISNVIGIIYGGVMGYLLRTGYKRQHIKR